MPWRSCVCCSRTAPTCTPSLKRDRAQSRGQARRDRRHETAADGRRSRANGERNRERMCAMANSTEAVLQRRCSSAPRLPALTRHCRPTPCAGRRNAASICWSKRARLLSRRAAATRATTRCFPWLRRRSRARGVLCLTDCGAVARRSIRRHDGALCRVFNRGRRWRQCADVRTLRRGY